MTKKSLRDSAFQLHYDRTNLQKREQELKAIPFPELLKRMKEEHGSSYKIPFVQFLGHVYGYDLKVAVAIMQYEDRNNP